MGRDDRENYKKMDKTTDFLLRKVMMGCVLTSLTTNALVLSGCQHQKEETKDEAVESSQTTDLNTEQEQEHISTEVESEVDVTGADEEDDTQDDDAYSDIYGMDIDEVRYEACNPHTQGVLQSNIYYTELNYYKVFGDFQISEIEIDGSYYYRYVSSEDGIEMLVNATETQATVLYQDNQIQFPMNGGFFHNDEYGMANLGLIDLTGDGVKELIYEDYFSSYFSEITGTIEPAHRESQIFNLETQSQIQMEDSSSYVEGSCQIEVVEEKKGDQETTYLVRLADVGGKEYYGYMFSEYEREKGDTVEYVASHSYLQIDDEGLSTVGSICAIEGYGEEIANFTVHYVYDEESNMLRIDQAQQIEMIYSAIIYMAENQGGILYCEDDVNLFGYGAGMKSTIPSMIITDIEYMMNWEHYAAQVEFLYEVRHLSADKCYQIYQATVDKGVFYVMYEVSDQFDSEGNYNYSIFKIKQIKFEEANVL